MDKVISVEYAVKDDDARGNGNGYSPERRRDRSPDRRRRSPSPYRRERGSPDYGRGASPAAAHRKERTSPDYGRARRSPSPYKRARVSPDYKRDDRRRERVASPGYRRDDDRRRDKLAASPENGALVRNQSPRNGRGESRSPPPYEKRRERERSRSRSKSSPENGQVESPGPIIEEEEAGRGYDGAESPMRESHSLSPPAEE
uniref:Serine/arginine-rich splicing factor RS41 n=1 Tax=Noccaea caerulescens TaxID=107243 RepID=A0A1J3DD69_NOCCA